MSLEYLKDAFLRRLWYIALPFFVISIATVVYLIRAPRIYRSVTLILVQPQEIPDDYVRSTVSTDARSRLTTLREQVMSRPRLEQIINKYDLYPKIRSTSTVYDAVQVMRKNIQLEVNEPSSPRDRSPASFQISFEGSVPAKVRDVTADIANLFIEDDLRLREQQAVGTSKFLDRELERMKERLRKKEELVRQFKEKYMGLLPEQMETNYRILSQLQQQLDSLNESLQQTEDRKVLLQSQLSRIEAIQSDVPSEDRSQGSISSRDEVDLSLDELRQRLEVFKSRYSEKHPDVARLAAIIALRENEEASVHASDRIEKTEAQQLLLAQREDFSTQLQLVRKEIRNLRQEKKETSREIYEYKGRIEEGPKIEQLLVDLRRGYEEASANYQSLLEKRLQAELAENLERTQKGEQFRILEPAHLPEMPVKPEILKNLMLGFVLALFSGLSLAYLREYQDPTFWSSKDMRGFIDVPVLVSIPVVFTRRELRWNSIKRMGTVGTLVSMGSALSYALFVLWRMDPSAFPIPLG